MSVTDIIKSLSPAAQEQLKLHSPVGPSSGERWIHCPGSVIATIECADSTSDFAAEGTFAHSICERALNDQKDAAHYLGVTTDDGKWTVDREMVDAVQDFLNYCDQFDGEYLVEQKVSYDEWVEEGWGTADFIAFVTKSKQCIVMDFKYGKGIQINAQHNYQLKLYALGVFQDWGELYDFDSFLLCISQPRLGHRDQWEISTEKLLKWADTVVAPAGKLAWTPDAPYSAGAWCQWCRIKGECKTRAAMMREAALLELDDDNTATSDPNIMTNEDLGKTALLIPQIKKWCGEVMDLIEKRVMKGEKIPSDAGAEEFYKMVEGRSTRKWRDEASVKVAFVKARLKADEYAPRKFITPPAAEKLLGKNHKILKSEVVKPQGKPVLVPGSDNRKPFKVSTDELDDVEDDTSWLD